jgi:hypothetical protein
MTGQSGLDGDGVCMAYCDTDDDNSCNGACVGYNEGNFPLCHAACDLLNQDCPQGLACYLRDGEHVCGWEGDGDSYASCGDQPWGFDECIKGHSCFNEGQLNLCQGQYCCLEMCDENNPQCPNGEFCADVQGLQGVGACIPN